MTRSKTLLCDEYLFPSGGEEPLALATAFHPSASLEPNAPRVRKLHARALLHLFDQIRLCLREELVVPLVPLGGGRVVLGVGDGVVVARGGFRGGILHGAAGLERGRKRVDDAARESAEASPARGGEIFLVPIARRRRLGGHHGFVVGVLLGVLRGGVRGGGGCGGGDESLGAVASDALDDGGGTGVDGAVGGDVSSIFALAVGAAYADPLDAPLGERIAPVSSRTLSVNSTRAASSRSALVSFFLG